MRSDRWSVRGNHVVLTAAVVLCIAACLCPNPAPSQDSGEASVCDAFWDMQYALAITLAGDVVRSAESSLAQKLDAYRCEACSYVAQRKLSPAKRSIEGMLRLDATSRFSPDYSYPPTVIDLYHAVRDSLFTGTLDIHTVAIGDFEDNSIFQGKFKNHDFSRFQGALTHTLTADLAQATDLKIVDRKRIDQILGELELGQSGFANPKQAVRAGELLGAHTFIFGQYMILSEKKVRIDARVVHTATGEIILTKNVTGEFAGDPEKFLELEQELVISLAQGIDQILGEGDAILGIESRTREYFDRKRDGIEKRVGYVESKFLTAEALELEDQGDYQAAEATWQKVLDVDPENQVASDRLRVLATIAQG